MRTPLISSLEEDPSLAVHITCPSLGVCSEFVVGWYPLPSSRAFHAEAEALCRTMRAFNPMALSLQGRCPNCPRDACCALPGTMMC